MREWISKLNEIELSSSDEEVTLDEFRQHFVDEPPVWIDPNDTSISIRESEGHNQTMLGVFKSEMLIALLVTEPYYRDPSIAQIKLTAVDQAERQQGFMRLLLTFFRDRNGRICSDGINSPSAKAMWKQLIAKPAGLKILIWDSENDSYQSVKGAPDSMIWNDEESTVLVIEGIDLLAYGFGRNLLTEQADFSHHRRWDKSNPLMP